ncbi:Kinase, CMGC CLK [Spironucleus salmonicida]|uniref:Kinase, CMGC CLK n=1 Tax=Spironucleus salmonicida TaxID=348837 RepID=V6LHD0_9EUKA|nr:Kinase, CMGC CLK [Spironucleus salmonicida]|eukprot:EST43970.1 Kinase, CMGC CLK [Spironucleus salmonicida]
MGEDDHEFHYVPVLGEKIIGRYQIVARLGKGTFGTVFSAKDLQIQEGVALKIIRAIPKYTAAGQRESQFLSEISKSRHRNKLNLAEQLDSFMFNDHLVIVFPLYGVSLLDLLKLNSYRGYNLDWTRELARIFMSGVKCLHDMNLIHTDIKPENIVSRHQPVKSTVRDRIFVHPPGANLVLIDLGSVIRFREPRPQLVCTRQYRPPEVVIGGQYNEKIDIWSCACVIFEISTGKTLFRTHSSAIHLAMIEKLIGGMPLHMEDQITKNGESYIDGQWQVPLDSANEEIVSYNALQPIDQELKGFKYNFIHLLKSMLQWDPQARISSSQALEHPFFMEVSKDSKQVQVNSHLELVVQRLVDGDVSLAEFKQWYFQEK